jgi:calcineurin-like phosphoesterase family protein
MLRPVVILGLTALLAGGATLASASPQIPPPRYVAVADASVSAAAPAKNFGRTGVLRIGGGNRAYVRFDLRRLAGATVTDAKLRLASLSPRGRFSIQLASNTWNERKITFRNAPRPGRRIAWPLQVRRGLLSIDVTHAVKAGKSVTFVLTAPRGAIRFHSRESRSAPRLDLVLKSSETLIAAGDIAYCGTPYDEATAALVKTIPGTVAALGDLAYETGSASEFSACYQPSWGAFKGRTRPAPGNHEYETPSAAGYFGYWGARAGNPAQGWYSYDLWAWHVIVLNSNCDFVGGCFAGSPQETWLRADLAAHPSRCTLAYWHHPLFSGGQVTYDPMTLPLWQALYDANADLVLVGHAHNYQRFAPQNPAGIADPARGIREFVVGTGGNPTLHQVAPVANTEVMDNTTWGVLRLTLRIDAYDWQFVRAAGGTFTDSGSQACH